MLTSERAQQVRESELSKCSTSVCETTQIFFGKTGLLPTINNFPVVANKVARPQQNNFIGNGASYNRIIYFKTNHIKLALFINAITTP